ncbi:hypothetical protein BC835DRAFT_1363647 [Cytidiella melzeri]|nr:hypothetical protein BC835DRAFT_1363647 [Cytidiella melzeri]
MSAESEAARNLAEFPDEILDEIIQAVGPRRRCGERRQRNHVGLEPERQYWSDCSLVCHRWNQITLPHIFRRVLITDPNLHLTTDSADVDDPFLLFLSNRPSIAQLIQHVTFDFKLSSTVPLPTEKIVRTIRLLPRLRYLSLFKYPPSFIVSETTHRDINRELDYGDCKLERFDCTALTAPREHYPTIVELIGRFSEIGTLHVRGPYGHSGVSDSAARYAAALAGSKSWKLHKIHELLIDGQRTPPSYYLILLPELNVLRHLTCLSFNCEPSHGMEDLSRLLQIVGLTLGEFYLTVPWDWLEGTQVGDSSAPLVRDQFVSALRSGFAACSVLHGFRLKLHLNIMIKYFDESTIGPAWLEGIIDQAWLLGIDILALVHFADQLRHLSFCFGSMANAWKDHQSVAASTRSDTLSGWSNLRQACRRFVLVKSIKVHLQSPQHPVEVGTERVRREMQEFEDVLRKGESGAFTKCEEESCRWYDDQ